MLTAEQIAALVAAMGAPKLLIRMIDAIQQGTGTLTAPYFVRKNAEARADGESYRIKKLATAMHDVKYLGASIEYKDGKLFLTAEKVPEADLESRYLLRSEHDRHRRQSNVEAVTAAAVEELLNDPEVESLLPSNEPIDPDWISSFFRSIEEVSDEDMQRLWAKVLAGEVKHSNSYGKRTLEFLRTLSKEEAVVFEKIAPFAMSGSTKRFIADFGEGEIRKKYGFTYLDIFLMTEIGVIYPKSVPQQSNPGSERTVFVLGRHGVRVTHNKPMSIPTLSFTKVGEELLRLVPPKFNLEYIKDFLRPWQSEIEHLEYGLLEFQSEQGVIIQKGTEQPFTL